MIQRIFQTSVILVSSIILLSSFFIILFLLRNWENTDYALQENSFLVLNHEGPIFGSSNLLNSLRKYRNQPEIKGVLIKLDSPGGAIGPCQELYSEIKRTKEIYKKIVVVSAQSTLTSGAYYIASASSQIVVLAGTLVGALSANTIKRNDKNQLLKHDELDQIQYDQSSLAEYLSDVNQQLFHGIQMGRQLSIDLVQKYGDGRVFTGETAVRLGFADKLGDFEDAFDVLAHLVSRSDNIIGRNIEFNKFSPSNKIVNGVLSKLSFFKEDYNLNFTEKAFNSKVMYMNPGDFAQ